MSDLKGAKVYCTTFLLNPVELRIRLCIQSLFKKLGVADVCLISDPTVRLQL